MFINENPTDPVSDVSFIVDGCLIPVKCFRDSIIQQLSSWLASAGDTERAGLFSLFPEGLGAVKASQNCG